MKKKNPFTNSNVRRALKDFKPYLRQSKQKLYDQIHIDIYLKPGKELTRIDKNAMSKTLEEAFEILLCQWKRRGLSSKLRIEMSK